jgi:hypothetical protein
MFITGIGYKVRCNVTMLLLVLLLPVYTTQRGCRVPVNNNTGNCNLPECSQPVKINK